MSNNFKNPITGRFMKKDIAWVDRYGKELRLQDISDDYLFKIMVCIPQDIGYECILSNRQKISAIYEEAYKRNISNGAVIYNLHTWALCVHGFDNHWPSWFLDPDNNIYKESINSDTCTFAN
jgi:hypothetical protein